MQYLIDIRNPGHEMTTVTADELSDAYAHLKELSSPTVVWNDGDEEEVEVDMGGTDSRVPRKALAPRELGLTVLRRAGDLPGLRTDYTWDEQ